MKTFLEHFCTDEMPDLLPITELNLLVLHILAVASRGDDPGTMKPLDIVDSSDGAITRGGVYDLLNRTRDKGLIAQLEDGSYGITDFGVAAYLAYSDAAKEWVEATPVAVATA